MFNKKLLAAALLIATAGVAQAEEAATAEVTWLGNVSSTVDGETLKITGAGGGEIGSGTLSVSEDGSFTASSVVVESRAIADDALTDAMWTFNNVSYIVGGEMLPVGNLVKVVDTFTGDTVLDGATAGKELGTVGVVTATNTLNLQPSLDASSLGLEVQGQANLQLTISAQVSI